MLLLDATTKSLEVKLAGAVATTELPFVAGYVDMSQATFGLSAAGENDGTTNGATAVEVAAAPGASTTRKLNYFSLVNVDTASVTATVQVNNSGTKRISIKAILAVGDQLEFTDAAGWRAFDANGQIKTGPTTVSLTAGVTGVLPIANGGTGLSSYAVGDLVYYAAGTALSRLAAVALGSVLISGGVGAAPSWSATPTFVATNLTSIPAAQLTGTITSATQDLITRLGTITSGVWNAGAVTSSGLLTVNGGGEHLFSANVAGANSIKVKNTSTTAGQTARFELHAGSNDVAGLYAYNQNEGGTWNASQGVALYNASAGGLSLVAASGSGAIRFYSGGTTLRWTMDTSGHLTPNGGVNIGDTTNMVNRVYIEQSNPLYIPNITPTTGTALIVDASGYMRSLTSSARHKEHMTPWVVPADALARFVALAPQNWDYKGQPNGAAGFVSEDLDGLGILNAYGTSPLINYNKDGLPESNRDYALIGLQHLAIQQLWKQGDEHESYLHGAGGVEERLRTLEERIGR